MARMVGWWMVEGGWGWDATTGDEEDGEESAEDDEGCGAAGHFFGGSSVSVSA
jgi:hypothetical protein